jgi:hypothetical protein
VNPPFRRLISTLLTCSGVNGPSAGTKALGGGVTGLPLGSASVMALQAKYNMFRDERAHGGAYVIGRSLKQTQRPPSPIAGESHA